MIRIKHNKKVTFWLVLLLLELIFFCDTSPAQEEVTSSLSRYEKREYSNSYYEEYEVLPKIKAPVVAIPGVKRGVFPYSPFGAEVRSRLRLSDSHQFIQFYKDLRCEFCHIEQTKDIHITRANLTCRQCHGGEPIASINHFYSPLNPIRRHAYVCAKCHQGANASFASYIVHEPQASSPEARMSFPLLYYSYWFMFLLLAGVLFFFLPHSIIGAIQELAVMKGKRGIDIAAFFIPEKYRNNIIDYTSRKIGPGLEKFYSLEISDLKEIVIRSLFLKPKAVFIKVKEFVVHLFIK